MAGHELVIGEGNRVALPPLWLLAVAALSTLSAVGRGVMKAYKTAADLAKDMGVPAANLQKTFEECVHVAIALKLHRYNKAAVSKKDVYGRMFFDHAPMRQSNLLRIA